MMRFTRHPLVIRAFDALLLKQQRLHAGKV
jgi:hypothetical protein